MSRAIYLNEVKDRNKNVSDQSQDQLQPVRFKSGKK